MATSTFYRELGGGVQRQPIDITKQPVDFGVSLTLSDPFWGSKWSFLEKKYLNGPRQKFIFTRR